MSREHTIGRWLADRARATPDRVAIRFLGGELVRGAGLAREPARRGS